MGHVMKPEVAFNLCNCYQIGPTEEPEDILCYSEGVIGTLSNDQDRICKKRIIQPASKELKDHLMMFGRISKECAIGNTYIGKKGGTHEVKNIIDRSRCILSKSVEY